MRHFFRRLLLEYLLAMSRLPSRVAETPLRGGLIALTRLSRQLSTGLLRAGLAAVPLAAVAVGADRYQALATSARKEPVVLPHRQPPTAGSRRRSEFRPYWRPGRGGNVVFLKQKAQGDRQVIDSLGLRHFRQRSTLVAQRAVSVTQGCSSGGLPCGKRPLFPRTPITPAGGLPGYGRLPPPPSTRHPPTPLGKRSAFSTAHRPRRR